VKTNHNGAQSFPTAEYSDARLVASVPQNPYIVGYARTSASQEIPDFCASSEDGSWSDEDAREAATVFWGVLEADEYLQSLGLTVDDASWSHADGDGNRRVSTIWVPESLAEADCTGAKRSNAYGGIPRDGTIATDGGEIIAISGAQGPPTNPSIMAHEYAHLLLDWARRLGEEEELLSLRESGSIKEGFSDVFALASTHARIPNDPFWPCIPLDGTCIRDLGDPTSTGLPDYFGLAPYVDYSDYDDSECGTACSGPDNDRCGTHDNSTILGHWAYLLGTGSAAGHGVCGTVVEPLSEDEGEAYRIILDVLLNAAARRVGPLVSFEELKDATLVTAEDLYPETDVEAKMRRAWLAVGLERHPQPEDLMPPDGKTGVEAWLDWYPRVRWKAEGTGPWEMQVSNKADFCDASQSSCFVDEYEAVSDEAGDAVFDGKLRPDQKLFWRARQAGDPSWEACNVVAGGNFSTAAETMRTKLYRGSKLIESDESDANTTISTDYGGNVLFEFNYGRDGYDYVYTTEEPDPDRCDSADAEVTELPWFKVVDDPLWEAGSKNMPYSSFVLLDNNLKESETGFLSVRPFALHGSEKLPGKCSTFALKRTPLDGALLLSPQSFDVVPIDLFHPTIPPFRFTKSDNAESYTLSLHHHPSDAEEGSLEAVNGNLIYEDKRSPGDCGLEESDGEMSWNLADCDQDVTALALDHLKTGRLRWSVILEREDQLRGAVREDDYNNATIGPFYIVPDHVPPKVNEYSESGPVPARGWISVLARDGEGDPIYKKGHNHNSPYGEPEQGVVELTGLGEVETVVYYYNPIIHDDRELDDDPYRVELCIDTDLPIADEILLGVTIDGSVDYQSPWIPLNEDDDRWCKKFDIGEGDWRAYIMTRDDQGHLSTRITELGFKFGRSDEPEEEEEEEEPDAECKTPPQVEMPSTLQASAQTAYQPGSLDYDDPCDILRSFVFDKVTGILPLTANGIRWGAVEGATDYEMVIHPISTEEDEKVECWSVTREDQFFHFNDDAALGNVPYSSTGAYEFIIRAINKLDECNEVGPWSEVGAGVVLIQ